MSEATYRVMFLCNDDRGNFAGHVEQIEVSEEVRLVCAKPRPPTMKWADKSVQIGKSTFACGEHETWVGNIFWDAALLTASQARQLVGKLLKDGWSVEEHADAGPFADLVRSA